MAQSICPTNRVYVDQVTGNDSNQGTKAAPFASLGTASARLSAVSKVPGTIFLRAPESTPYQNSVTFTVTTRLDVAPWDTPRFYLNGAPSTPYGIRLLGTGTVNLFRGHVIGHSTAGIRLGDTGQTGGTLNLYDTYAEGAESGVQTVGVWTALNAWRCEGHGGTNDGWNIHGDAGVAGHAIVYDCTATGCGDEGISPHNDTLLDIYGGHYDGNAGGGMNCVDNAVVNIRKSLVDSSRVTFNGNGHDLTTGGIGYFGATSGSIDGADAKNNTGPGFKNVGTGSVTKTDVISTSNGAADVG